MFFSYHYLISVLAGLRLLLIINTTVGTTLHVVDTVWRDGTYKANTVIIELSEY